MVERAGVNKAFAAIAYIQGDTIRDMMQLCIETPYHSLRAAWAGREEPGAASGARAQRLHRKAGDGERRQADAVRAVQRAVPCRQCEDPARLVERRPVPRPRRLPRTRP